jgi:hypothetical protein
VERLVRQRLSETLITTNFNSFLVVMAVLCAQAIAQTTLVGSNTIQPFSDYVSAGRAAAFKRVAAASGTADTLAIYVDAADGATKIMIGLYSDNGGIPSALLASGVLNSPAKGAWNSVGIQSTSITSGATYWLALLGNSGTPVWRDSSNCSVVQTSGIGSLSALPTSWPKGTNYQWCNPSMYAWHAGTQIGVTISPTSATINTGGTQQFAATVSNCGTNCGVNWSVTGNGTVDFQGFYIAPATAETDTITASAQADLTKKASAAVKVVASTTQHTVTLNWQDSAPVTFNLYRGSVSGGPYALLSSGISLRTYSDSTVQSGHTYYYVITAFDGSSESAYSNQVRAMVPYP